MTQMKLDYLLLWCQGLHRVAGAGHLYYKSGKGVLFAAIIPPRSLSDNPNIVIVDSHNGRNGYDNNEEIVDTDNDDSDA